jgi:nucleoside-diphosphate-sugar epimerase
MEILLIGGTGNISAACASALHESGHQVSVLSRGHRNVSAQYRKVLADRRNVASMQTALKSLSPDVVINFLGYELSDVQLDYELLNGRIRQYIFISSATVYSKPPPKLPITEDTPLGNPYWDYAQKKTECENWLRARLLEKQFPVTIVRPSHTYSEWWVPNPLSSSSYTYAARLESGRPVFVPDDGENPWTLTTSSDFAAGLAGLTGMEQAVGETFHITSDEVLTWNQIVAEIASALGVVSPEIIKAPTDLICQVAPRMAGTLRGDKVHPGIFDNSKIKRFVPAFQCRTLFREGVRRSLNWLRENADQQNLNPRWDEICEAIVSACRST